MKLRLKKILQDKIIGENTVVGWIRSVRKTKKFSFIILNDGSTSNSLQVIADSDLENYDEVSSMLAGTSVEISGVLVESQGKGQDVEMQANAINIIGTT
ncbi:MAG: asparagine--tRNA ligase, partial [Bdellovibrionales bacterium]|nr:asparagine--tRNA ligase [Bdellovibrionales bacterium]